jgi:hypothetical protein
MATFKAGQIEREKRPEAFTYETSAGVEVKLADPKRMHFVELDAINNQSATRALKTLAGDEAYKDLVADPELDMEGANQLMEAWRQHYGLGDQGN